jgi:hypothetical protein
LFPQKLETIRFIGPQLLLYKISQFVFLGKTAICETHTMHSYSGFGKLSQQFRAIRLSYLCTVNKYFGIWDSVLNTVTRSGWTVSGSNTGREKMFSPPKSSDLLWVQPSPISVGSGVLSWD